jgi:hypothetical protein
LQQLQWLQTKLLRAEAVFDSALDITRSCVAHCRTLNKLRWTSAETSAPLCGEFDLQEGQLSAHRASLGRVMRQLQGTKELVCTPERSSQKNMQWHTRT